MATDFGGWDNYRGRPSAMEDYWNEHVYKPWKRPRGTKGKKHREWWEAFQARKEQERLALENAETERFTTIISIEEVIDSDSDGQGNGNNTAML